MDPRAAPLAGLLRLNARLVANCFDDVDDMRAAARALPALAELLRAWHAVDAALAERLPAVSARALDEPATPRYPGDDPSVLGALAFLVQHDSYHLGQLALLRRAHGLPTMRYGARRA